MNVDMEFNEGEKSGHERSKFLTINQAAEYLDVSRHKIRRLIKGGKLHAVVDKYDSRCRLVNIEELKQMKEYYTSMY